MLIVQIPIVLVLLLIFIQDITGRSVYWVLFLCLFVLFFILRLVQREPLAATGQSFAVNVLFFSLQLAVLSAYFSLKNRRWVNITDGLLGWGDILFLLAAAVYLSVLNFLFFYVAGLIAVLLVWALHQALSKQKNNQVPLAGLQALFFIVILAADWWFKPFGLTGDAWLLNLIMKWT